MRNQRHAVLDDGIALTKLRRAAGGAAIDDALEARAAEARAEIDVVEALSASGTTDAEVLRARREAASGHLTKSVAALEGIRLDLLRLHAGASDLAPLTTLIQEARVLSEDIERLAEAQREVDDAVARPRPSLDAPSD